MEYIVLDLEWNYPMQESQLLRDPFPFESEIIEIGAIKLNDALEPVDEFKTFVRPVFYPVLNVKVNALTKIRGTDLKNAPLFPEAFEAFETWCGPDSVFLTWGPDDIPVLMDNLLYHNMSIELQDSFDLQRIFGREIMQDDRQCSLENALSTLQIPQDRAHDALNDARSTARICRVLDFTDYLQEYVVRYVNYAEDRRNDARCAEYTDRAQALEDPAVSSFLCPCCGAALTAEEWTPLTSAQIYGYAVCPEGSEFLVSVHAQYARNKNTFLASRRIYEMSDDLWEKYRDRLSEDGNDQDNQSF